MMRRLEKAALASTLKAVALDLDDTIISKPLKRASERTVAALRACMERGLAVIICTGRSPLAAEGHRASIGAQGPAVYSNGAQIVDMPARRALETTPLSLEAAAFCNALSLEKGLYFQVFFTDAASGAEFVVTESAGPEREVYHARTGMEIRVSPLREALAGAEKGSLACIKGIFLFREDNLDKVDEVREAVLSRFPTEVGVTRSCPTFLEILPGGISKGRGLLRALSYRGISPEHTIAFGDEENDIPLLQAAGFSGAPANARDTVKACADFVVGPCDEDGVAIFLEETLGL